MSTSIAVYLRAESLPDSGWLFRSVSAMERTFVFVEGFDPATDEGWIPCRIGDADCGFEWECGEPGSVPPELARKRFDRVATVSWRSSALDGVSAALVAANIASITGGTLEAPDGGLVDPDDALQWATETVAGLKKLRKPKKTRPKPPKPDPGALVDAWLGQLRGAQLAHMSLSLPDDPLVSLRFEGGVRLQTRRWAIAAVDGASLSTHALPRDMGQDEQQVRARAVDALIAAFRAGPIVSAALDAATLELRFDLTGATFTVYPQAARYASLQEQLFRVSDRWDLMEGDLWVRPDVDEGVLVVN